MAGDPDSPVALADSAPRALVLRNASYLIAAQVLVTPLSMLVNVVAGRTLGAVDYGRLYQALTYASFVFLLVEWGQSSTLTAKVALARTRAGVLLGSGLAWRVIVALGLIVGLPPLALLSGAEPGFALILFLTLLAATFGTVASACQDVFRGFERTDFAAACYVGGQLLIAAAVVPTLLAGAGLRGYLIAQTLCAAAAVIVVLRLLPRLQIPRLSVRAATVRELFIDGRPFLAFGVILVLQPMIDVAMLAHFGSPQAMGWQAVARKLVGILVYPASALIAALYPTLCRLFASDPQAYRTTGAEALHTVAIAVMPLALGCALFPGLGIAIFGQDAYGPAQDNLRLLAPYILLVYFSMPVGCCLTASGRQVSWAVVQFACVIVSVLFDPSLIGWFQNHFGNGGLGVCATTLASEVLMVAGGLYLLPSGILDRALMRRLALALLAGLVMTLTAWLLMRLPELLRAVLSVAAYALCLQCTGAINVMELRDLLSRARQR